MTDETDTIASEFFAAIERGDLNAVRELYSPEAAIWHNVTGRSQTREENLALLQYFTGRVSELRYEVIAREFLESSRLVIGSPRQSASSSMSSGERSTASSSTSTLPPSAVPSRSI